MRKILILITVIISCLFIYLLPDLIFGGSPLILEDKINNIVVIKSQRRLMLMDGQKVIKSYPVALGENRGAKTKQGDKKTPEGTYKNCYLKEASTFYKAIHITYPNPEERQQGYTGGNIEIHGLPRLRYGLERYFGTWIILFGWTDGCVMLTNQEMDEIVGALQSPVTVKISP
jgi:murein L,D-transpeptidase YafK